MAVVNAGVEQINRITYAVTNNLLYQLNGKIHYECPYSQHKFFKLNGKSTYSLISKYGSRLFSMILLLIVLTFYSLFSILISPSLIASQIAISISDIFTASFIY